MLKGGSELMARQGPDWRELRPRGGALLAKGQDVIRT
jgi:hypothetical protein